MSNFKVMNLATGEYVPINSHPLSAAEAVVWAWCDFSGEPYLRDYRSHPLLEFVSSRTVSCGEHPNVFSCRLDPEITPEQVFFIKYPQYQGCVITPFSFDTNTGMRLAFLNDPSGNCVGCVSRKGFASFIIHRR